ncbi:MAG: hypothetical protein JWR54_1432 [Mucilaginibacter sp.]|nr:hypothetical protein [Mucilaginibacter sp.]
MSRKVHYIQSSLFNENAEGTRTSTHQYISRFSQTYSSKIKVLESVITKLRKDDLGSGHCFLIFDDNLPEDQAYYEYPDGSIRIEQLDKSNIEIPRVIVKVLSKTETAAVRKRHALTA